ncbi:uncharacterized protein EI97DRAFT_457689 [Westerdykella ornata]|uniref:BTB domain-containing protein n=1 Tax=Westerdykella ornata TaxID=318751 RepID=A0A6A6JKE1_WESOR|nr:uncharacterized protein EI97DRAFT_457689 [Westerdykella ornata]KAF2276942.1 hypothetical protein EI97DRAFT_457689 [Westerdykella ornata]
MSAYTDDESTYTDDESTYTDDESDQEIDLTVPKCPHARKRPSPKTYGQMITVVVGKGKRQRSFQVYEGLLTYWSSYFRAALSPAWKEANSNIIELPEDSAKVFEAFFHWLFTERLEREGTSLSSRLICKLYVFSDARGIPELGNAAIDLLFQKTASDWIFPAEDIGYIYRNTRSASGLRKFIQDDSVCIDWAESMEEGEKYPPAEFFADILARVSQGTLVIPSFERRPTDEEHIENLRKKLCEYHEHPDTSADTERSRSASVTESEE